MNALITVIKDKTLGNGGPIYGEGLYSELIRDTCDNYIPKDSSHSP